MTKTLIMLAATAGLVLSTVASPAAAQTRTDRAHAWRVRPPSHLSPYGRDLIHVDKERGLGGRRQDVRTY